MDQPAPAYRGDQPYVFVCYAHKDKVLVYPQITWLQEQGINVWYDEGISPGEEWSEELGQAINDADRLMFFITPRSVASRHCRNEIHFAQNHQTPVLAVYLEETALPVGIELAIGSSHAIYAYEESEGNFLKKLSDVMGATSTYSESKEPKSAPFQRSKTQLRLWIAILSAGLIAAGLAIWLAIQQSPLSDAGSFRLSVAMTPFALIGDEAEIRSYAAGLTNEVKAQLTSYQELRMVEEPSRTESTATHGPALANYLISGNAQKISQNLRLRVQLARNPDNHVVWSQTYEEPMAPAIANQTQLAVTLARYIRLQIAQDHQCETVSRKTRSGEAAAAFCAAQAENYRLNQVGAYDPQIELDYAQTAISHDPDLADAYWLVANGVYFLGVIGQLRWQDAASEAHSALDKGLKLEPDNPWLLFMRGVVQADFDLDYDSSEVNMHEALAANSLHPNARWFHGALGSLELRRGNVTEALTHYRRAIRIYDSDARIYQEYARTLLFAEEHRKAIEAARESLLLAQGGLSSMLSYFVIVQAHVALGEIVEANATIEESFANLGSEWRPWMSPMLALVDRNEEARALLEGRTGLHPDIMVFAYTALGDKDLAFEWVHKAIDLRSSLTLRNLRTDPLFTNMRQDSRWLGVMEHLEEEAEGHQRYRESSVSPH